MSSLKCKQKLRFPWRQEFQQKESFDSWISQKLLKVICKKTNSICKSWFVRTAHLSPGVKGQKIAQIEKNYICHVPCLRKSIAYNHNFCCNSVKWWYLQAFFSFFSNSRNWKKTITSLTCQRVKWQKWPKMTKVLFDMNSEKMCSIIL